MWFREHDLRCKDNTALYHASHTTNDGLIALFLISPKTWQRHDMAPCRMDFIRSQLKQLSTDLEQFNIPLLIETIDDNIPEFLLSLSQKHQIHHLFFNEQHEINELRRDQKIKKLFNQHNIDVTHYCDHVILAPGEVLTQQGKYFTVFTPFKNAWLKKLHEKGGACCLGLPKPQKKLAVASSHIPEISENKLWPTGEAYAQKRLTDFVTQRINHYQRDRDFPALNGTSTLSPYLTSGIISPRICFNAAIGNNVGITTWINELIWREFYKHILFAFPRVAMHKPFQLNTEKIVWDNNQQHFQAWCEGKTGIPIIDAAMRQLNTTGWMHNRLRMIVAMFLTKNLFIDWRLGEKYFMQHLIDGDLAANNGGWQWSASTGTDAAPYFRIFNPLTQAKKFDPENKFIQQYCPEALSGKNYPKPIVDLSASRKRAIETFKSLRH